MRRLSSLLIYFLFGLFFLVSPLSVSAAEKSFFFPKVSINIDVNSNGTINFMEERTFQFNGSFSRIYWDIPLRTGESVADIEVKGYPTNISYSDTGVYVEAYHDSYNEIKTFVLTYKLTGAIKKHQDFAEFY